MSSFNTEPERVNDFHAHSDLDAGDFSQHHTLGWGPNQAAPGLSAGNRLGNAESRLTNLENEVVASTNSIVIAGKLVQWGNISMTFTAASATQAVTFPVAFSSPPIVIGTIAGGSGSSTFLAQATGITATGFNAFVVQRDGSSVAVSGLIFNWIAIGNA